MTRLPDAMRPHRDSGLSVPDAGTLVPADPSSRSGPHEAFSIRGLSRAYGISRRRIACAIAAGELHAARLGKRRFIILRRDAERWIREKGGLEEPARIRRDTARRRARFLAEFAFDPRSPHNKQASEQLLQLLDDTDQWL